MKMRILLNKMVLNGTLLALGTLAPLAGATPAFKSFRIPTANSEPEGITLGPDGNMWFTEAAANQIGRIDLKGNITEFVVPQPLSSPVDIVAGADGALWFTEESGFPEGIGRVTTGGVFTGFAPNCGGGQPCSLTPRGIAATADGLAVAQRERPDLMLLDLMMPGITGFDVITALQQDEATRSIPIVVLGSQIIMRLIDRFPVLVLAGGGLLGYIAGDMAIPSRRSALVGRYEPVHLSRAGASPGWVDNEQIGS